MYAFACLKKKYFADSENCIIFVFGKQEQKVLVKV